MENCSNCNSSGLEPFRSTGFLVFSIIMPVVAVVAILFNILIFVILFTRLEVFAPIRMIIVSLLAGTIFTAVAVVMQNTDSAVLVAASNTVPIIPVCKVYVLFFRSSAAVRLCTLAVYSIAVLRVVIKGKNHLKSVHVILPIIVVWVYTLLLSIHWVVPSASTYTYIDGVRCTTHFGEDRANLETVLLALWIVLGGIFPFIVCIAVIIIAWCFLRKHKLTEVNLFKKGLVHLALFLLLANVSNLVNMIVPPILIQVDPGLSVTSYLITILDTVMLWSTGIIVLIFIRPRKSNRVVILCCSWCTQLPSNSSRVQSQAPYTVSLLDHSAALAALPN